MVNWQASKQGQNMDYTTQHNLQMESQKLILKTLTIVKANCSECQGLFTGERWSVKVTYLRVQCKTKERNQAAELG